MLLSKYKKPKSFSWKGLFGLLLCVFLFRSLVFVPFRIPSGSMIPTLLVGDFIGTPKWIYGWGRYSFPFSHWIPYMSSRVNTKSPKRGDILVFAFPPDTSQDFIKRVVGLPGEKIEMIDGHLVINNHKMRLDEIQKDFSSHDGEEQIFGTLYEQYLQGSPNEVPFRHLILKQKPFGVAYLDHMDPIVLEPDYYFMMGDNRDGSSDSRDPRLGPVHIDYFIGPSVFIWMSIDTSECSWLQPWMWPFKIRYRRVFQKIH